MFSYVFMVKEAAGTVSQHVHFGYILLTGGHILNGGRDAPLTFLKSDRTQKERYCFHIRVLKHFRERK